MIARNCDTYCDEPALVDGEQRFSYSELAGVAKQCALALAELGLVRGDKVAIWSDNCWQWVVIAMACWQQGYVLAPLSHRLKPLEIVPLLEMAEVRCLFAGTDRGQTLFEGLFQFIAEHSEAALTGLRFFIAFDGMVCHDKVLSWPQFLRAGHSTNKPVQQAINPHDICEILFTSGTTGLPKGVCHSHRQVLDAFWTACHLMSAGQRERRLVIPPFSHIYGLHSGIVQCLQMGSCHIISRDNQADRIIALIRRENVSAMAGPPSLFAQLLAEHRQGNPGVGQLDFVTTGGAPVPKLLIRGLKEAGVKFVQQVYGLSECCPVSCTGVDDSMDVVSETMGFPVPGIEVKICNEAGETLVTGETGVIYVKGNGLMQYYLNDSAQTNAALQNGWLATGDAGALTESGRLVMKGRKKDMYISHGFNVYPAEVERLLMASGMLQAIAVVPQSNRFSGESSIAYLVPENPGSFELAEFSAWATRNIANYKLPLKFLILDSLPLNTGGKIARHLLTADPQPPG